MQQSIKRLVRRGRALVVAAATLSLALAACGSSSGDDGGTGAAGGSKGDVKTIGIEVGASTPDWQPAQGKVAAALAKQRGWKTVVLNNNGDGPTALKNADIFIQKHVEFVLQFQADSSVNPVLSKKLGAAHIPVVTYDIAGPDMYFVGVDNNQAGIVGGRELGDYAKRHWGCKPDLVLLGSDSAAGDANALRIGGYRTGLKQVCPSIADSAFVEYENKGDVDTAAQAARDVLSAHPSAQKVLIGGLDDAAVVGGLNAAEQLGREQAFGWGQDGSLVTGKNADPHLLGSVLYFLEGYPTYAYEQILDKLAAGQSVKVGDTIKDPTVRIPPCPVTREQAVHIPDTAGRVERLLNAPKGTTELDLFCPGH